MYASMKFLKKIDNGLARIEGIILVVLVIVMVGLSFLQVVLRNIFQTGILWADPLNRHLVLWVGFIGASLAAQKGRHITIDALSRFMPELWKRFSALIINMISLIICAILAKASFDFILSEREMGATVFLDVPAWYVEAIIPIGFGLLAFRFFLHFLLSLRTIFDAWGRK